MAKTMGFFFQRVYVTVVIDKVEYNPGGGHTRTEGILYDLPLSR
jgi:hypothetical protein